MEVIKLCTVPLRGGDTLAIAQASCPGRRLNMIIMQSMGHIYNTFCVSWTSKEGVMIPSFLSLLACRQRSQQPTSRAQKHHIHSTPPPTSLNRQAPQEPARQSMPSPLPLPPRLAPLSNHLPTHWYTYAYRFTLLHMKLPFASQTHDTSSCAYHSASCALPPSSCLQWSIYFLTIAAFSRAYYSHAYSYAIQLIDAGQICSRWLCRPDPSMCTA